jgi:hypothetical protein
VPSPTLRHYLTAPTSPRWRCTDKWAGATRQAIHHISFLDSNPAYVCASGLDSEVVCGCWGKPPPPVSVRPYGIAAAAAAAAGEGNAAGGGGGGGSAAGATDGVAAAAPGPSGAAAPRHAAAGGGADDDDGPGPSGGAFSFRSDSRWLGVAKSAAADTLAGVTAAGSIVYAEVAEAAAAAEVGVEEMQTE